MTCDDLQVRMHKDVLTVTMVATILLPLGVKGTVSFRRALYLHHPVLSLGNQAHTRATTNTDLDSIEHFGEY